MDTSISGFAELYGEMLRVYERIGHPELVYQVMAESDDDVRGIVEAAVRRGLPAGDVCAWAIAMHDKRGTARGE